MQQQGRIGSTTRLCMIGKGFGKSDPEWKAGGSEERTRRWDVEKTDPDCTPLASGTAQTHQGSPSKRLPGDETEPPNEAARALAYLPLHYGWRPMPFAFLRLLELVLRRMSESPNPEARYAHGFPSISFK